MKKLIILLMIIIMPMLFIKCYENKIDEKAELKEISKVIDSSIGWFKNKDFSLLFNVIANDTNYICVSPTSSIIRGYTQFKKSTDIFKRSEFQYVRHELKDLAINISNSRDVAWYYCILDDINSWDGQPANWENIRWTGVAEKRDGKWILVQQHFSFPTE